MTKNTITGKDLKSALPDTSKTFRLKGIDALIEIYRDRFGVPHVRAQTAHDAFFGQGLVTAQDRLW
ncbi:MAG: penicillin acylase family protein, partial [Deltaproteobacteria bacterium]|nr:penicillin acylase family protein [Deltaproteobacteria bacterium]